MKVVRPTGRNSVWEGREARNPHEKKVANAAETCFVFHARVQMQLIMSGQRPNAPEITNGTQAKRQHKHASIAACLCELILAAIQRPSLSLSLSPSCQLVDIIYSVRYVRT